MIENTDADQIERLNSRIVELLRDREGLMKALILAEDVLSRSPFSTQIWPNGMHPNAGIKQIRAALGAKP